MSCVIVDYGMGNLRSIEHKLLRLGLNARIGSTPDAITTATSLILPGIGHFAEGMKNLCRRGWLPALEQKVRREATPLLGICLGMQLLTSYSEEGDVKGLGWIPGRTRKLFFENLPRLPVPHMGWSALKIKDAEHPLFSGIRPQQRFYFVHSYYVECENSQDVLATACYGIEFAAAIGRHNIWGVQFHPEKSHREGMLIFRNFFNAVWGRMEPC